VSASGSALVAGTAGSQRIDRYALTRAQVGDLCPDRHHRPGAFVADNPREFGDLRTDAARRVVMNVGAANADGFDLDQRIAPTGQIGLGRLANLNLPDS